MGCKHGNIADGHAQRAMNVPVTDPTPPYISIHIRHGDFSQQCGEFPVDQCFAPCLLLRAGCLRCKRASHTKKGLMPPMLS
ncbi:hypothetical protein EV424DRAFT_1449576 [Suillus variegatus]|nr:hypothetical protein EV424DRAFT_1449576 [Suillus variegatus]